MQKVNRNDFSLHWWNLTASALVLLCCLKVVSKQFNCFTSEGCWLEGISSRSEFLFTYGREEVGAGLVRRQTILGCFVFLVLRDGRADVLTCVWHTEMHFPQPPERVHPQSSHLYHSQSASAPTFIIWPAVLLKHSLWWDCCAVWGSTKEICLVWVCTSAVAVRP